MDHILPDHAVAAPALAGAAKTHAHLVQQTAFQLRQLQTQAVAQVLQLPAKTGERLGGRVLRVVEMGQFFPLLANAPAGVFDGRTGFFKDGAGLDLLFFGQALEPLVDIAVAARPVTAAVMPPGSQTRSAILNMEGQRVFVVYRYFMQPPPGQELPPGLPQPVIFLGLDLSPFEITRGQDRDHVFMLAGVAMLVGLACLLALYYAQRARESRRRQRRAEGEIRRLEEEIRRKEKLAAVGTLAAGVAHEIRNPLSSIKGYATYFGMRFPEGSEDRKAAGVMVREVERLNRVISELIGLSRPSDVRPVAAPLEDSVAHVLRLIAQDAEKRGVRLVNSLPAALPPARMDPDRLGQALLNICLNALDAMPDGGTLTLGCTVEKQHLVLSVTDTGQGIAPENLNHIFDPYFTTKGHGTGLGLATVHKIVEALEGEVYVQSRQATADTPGRTTFFIRLPQAGKAAGHPADGPDRQAGEPANRQKGED